MASPSRFEVDYVYVDTEAELEALVRSGLGARVSSPDIKQTASLITAIFAQEHRVNTPNQNHP